MADLAHMLSASTSGPTIAASIQPAGQPGPMLLEVLEAAQRLIAYCDNDAVGGTADGELVTFGLPCAKLNRALHDLRRAVQAMNRGMASEEACAMLTRMCRAAPRRMS
jgi:hypothetical protein